VLLRDFLRFVFSLSLSDEQGTHGLSSYVLFPRLTLVFASLRVKDGPKVSMIRATPCITHRTSSASDRRNGCSMMAS